MKIIKKNTELENQLKKLNKKSVIYQFFNMFILFGSAFLSFAMSNFFIFFIGFLFSQIFVMRKWKKNRNERNIIRSGVRGERNTAKQLHYLSDDWYLFNDLLIAFDKKESQIDHVLVGPRGVFIIESKYWNGDIFPGKSDEVVEQVKFIGGKKVSFEHYNPVKQVGTHVYRLSHFLKENGIHTWVQGCVYFSHMDVKIYFNDANIPVFSNSDNFYSYITQDADSQNLSSGTILKIVEILKYF
jgi:hypothetical protein